MPMLGLGVWQVPDGPECVNAVRWALELGYRHIDTAQAYGNEKSVGQGLRESRVPRDQVFITTKFYPARRDPVAEVERSLERLEVDRVDLYIGPEDIGRFNMVLRDRGCSPSTRAKHLRVLGACLQAAVFYRYAESNPVRALPPAQRPRPERKVAAYFENDELPRLFRHLCDEPYRSLCLVALKTGMRQG